MDRYSDLSEDSAGPLKIRCVPIDDGGYDPGGTYWGLGKKLFCVSEVDGVSEFEAAVKYVRAEDFAEAKAKFKNATWTPSVMEDSDLTDMVQGYISAALFFSLFDDEGDLITSGYGEDDLTPETLESMHEECKSFAEENQELLVALGAVMDIDWSRLGGDLWLTMIGSGSGFGDGDWPDPYDDLLDNAVVSHEGRLYVGDDGKVYCD
jgi:hypothetical protein